IPSEPVALPTANFPIVLTIVSSVMEISSMRAEDISILLRSRCRVGYHSKNGSEELVRCGEAFEGEVIGKTCPPDQHGNQLWNCTENGLELALDSCRSLSDLIDYLLGALDSSNSLDLLSNLNTAVEDQEEFSGEEIEHIVDSLGQFFDFFLDGLDEGDMDIENSKMFLRNFTSLTHQILSAAGGWMNLSITVGVRGVTNLYIKENIRYECELRIFTKNYESELYRITVARLARADSSESDPIGPNRVVVLPDYSTRNSIAKPSFVDPTRGSGRADRVGPQPAYAPKQRNSVSLGSYSFGAALPALLRLLPDVP
ncbi:unnamed protein product, partial [Darwinula stevensoni]